ncbi:MAG: head-tail adaptor protein [Pseudomonadota bacterium]
MARPALRRLMTLEAPSTAIDGGGGQSVTWAALGALWADVTAVTASEPLSGARDRARVTHRILVRGAPEGSPRRPAAHQRFRQGSRVFGILGVAEDDAEGRFLRCWVEEGGGG